MKAMTQKQAKAYVLDTANWWCIERSHYQRLMRLDYEELHYVSVEVRKIVNHIERFMDKNAPAVTGFRPIAYYMLDIENECLAGNSTSENQIATEIWKESRRKASESIQEDS
ncbi:MAG: hypothetical protein E7185_09950 [Erysipelotrichaceae bacterium]|nr:hypothetical protein [Erysipelotrichaceae bacterium]